MIFAVDDALKARSLGLALNLLSVDDRLLLEVRESSIGVTATLVAGVS